MSLVRRRFLYSQGMIDFVRTNENVAHTHVVTSYVSILIVLYFVFQKMGIINNVSWHPGIGRQGMSRLFGGMNF